MEFTITSGQILWVCSAIGALWGTWKIVKEIKKPNDDLKKQVENHEQKIASIEEEMDYLKQAVQLILECNLVMIDHDITNNGYPELEQTKEKLRIFLIRN